MPRLVRRDTERLLRGSVQFLRSAVAGLSAPRTTTEWSESHCLAVETGLLGASVELAMSACLVEAKGRDGILKRTQHAKGRRYKTAAEILADLLGILVDGDTDPAFLVRGVGDPDHRMNLETQIRRFKPLLVLRANALHAAEGCTHDVLEVLVADAAAFADLLAQSRCLEPYLRERPYLHPPPRERLVVMEELAGAIEQANGLREKQRLTLSLVAISDSPPADEEAWVDAITRVSVHPTPSDLAFLLRQSLPMQLVRASAASGAALHACIDPGAPHPLPIEPHFLKTSFTAPLDQFKADVASANGRTEDGILHLPPEKMIVALFADGLESVGLPEQGGTPVLTAHQAWPFILAGLRRSGHPGPVWHMAARTDDEGQLHALLHEAAALGNKRLRDRAGDFIALNQDRVARRPVGLHNRLSEHMVQRYRDSRIERARLDRQVEELVESPRSTADRTVALLIEERGAEGALTALSNRQAEGIDDVVAKRWALKIANAECDYQARGGLTAVLCDAGLENAHSACRRALMLADVLEFGPTLPLDTPPS